MNDNPLDALKPGDRVAIIGSGYGSRGRIVTVERRTPTTIIVAGRKFNGKTGREINSGSYYGRDYLSADVASVEEYHARALLDRAEVFLRSAGEWEDVP